MWGFLCLPTNFDTDFRDKLIQFGGTIAFAFLTAGACRLARFNITLNPQPKNPGRPGRKYFVGMPIPGGAGCLAAVVHLCLGYPIQNPLHSILWMAFIAFCAFLMVSTWRFWSSKSIDFHSRQAARTFVLLAFVIAGMWYFHRYVLFIIAVGYMISGVISRLTYSFKKGTLPPAAPPQEALGAS
jgi:CDP-diacylglycerol--serine O-phosphatidyltransferase